MNDDVTAAITDVTAQGHPYETRTVRVGKVDFVGFANAPKNLLEVYRSGLRHGERDFYVYQHERFSFTDAWEMGARVANTLLESGIVQGDRVGIWFRNYPEWIWSFMGTTAIGGIAVAMNAWWSTEEMIYGIEDSGIKLLIVDRERYDVIKEHIDELGLKVITVRTEVAEKATAWEAWIADASCEMPELDVTPESPATLLYTSGSTAHPKGVLSTHLSITNALLGWEASGVIGMRAMQIRRQREENQDPTPTSEVTASSSSAPAQTQRPSFLPASILSVPLFHVTGLVVIMLSSFRGGRKLVGMYKWDSSEALRIIQDEHITSFNGVPTMAWELAQSPDRKKYDLSSLQSAGGGGAPMAPEHARQIDRKLAKGGSGTGWGMTETQGLATGIGGDAFAQRPRSCGRAVPPLVKVVAMDDSDNHLPPNETGELCIWGIMNFSYYWNNPDATAETLHDGWVRTGDIGHVDDEGYVFITDRKKDIVIRGGENVGCQEVEALLYEHPDVLECSVFGIPHERLGETVAAVVCQRQDSDVTQEDIQEFAREHLARFQVPERIWIRKERLPRTATEKIFKRAIRSEILELLKQETHE